MEEELYNEDSEFEESPQESPSEEHFIDVMKFFSPGTAMRTALDDILRARMGALIVVDKEGLSDIMDGGFKINTAFSSQKLIELAKMDGAIILSSDLKRILYANTLLVPKLGLRTVETGTRHKAAERTARQYQTIVVAVSERRNKITLYWKDEKYVLENSSEILRRATETLQILEKQKDIFDDLLSHLNILEITDLVSTSDVCMVLQRMEIVRRVTENIRRYLVELGKEGTIVSMRLKELTRNLASERELILKDYFSQTFEKVNTLLEGMNLDFLLETANIMRLVFEELHDRMVLPQGRRILRRTGFLEKDLDTLLEHFASLGKIFDSGVEEFEEVFAQRSLAESFKKELLRLKEKILEGKRM